MVRVRISSGRPVAAARSESRMLDRTAPSTGSQSAPPYKGLKYLHSLPKFELRWYLGGKGGVKGYGQGTELTP